MATRAPGQLRALRKAVSPAPALLGLNQLVVRSAGAHGLQTPVRRRAGIAALPTLIADGVSIGRLGADEAADLGQFGGIRSLDLGFVHELAHHASWPAAIIVRRTTASNMRILYAFCASGVAPCMAAAAASRALCSLSGLPVRAFSAAVARHGTGAAAPSTMDALLTIPPRGSSTTATSAKGQSNDSFCPIFVYADRVESDGAGTRISVSSSPELSTCSRVTSVSGRTKRSSSAISRAPFLLFTCTFAPRAVRAQAAAEGCTIAHVSLSKIA